MVQLDHALPKMSPHKVNPKTIVAVHPQPMLSPQFAGKPPLQSDGSRQGSGWFKNVGKYLVVSLASIGGTLGVQGLTQRPQAPQVVQGPTLADDECVPDFPYTLEPIPMPEPIPVSMIPVAPGSPEEASFIQKIQRRTDAGFTVFNPGDTFGPFGNP